MRAPRRAAAPAQNGSPTPDAENDFARKCLEELGISAGVTAIAEVPPLLTK